MTGASPLIPHVVGLVGVAAILGIAFGFSSNRRWIRLRVVGAAFALQLGIAVLALYVPAGRAALASMARSVDALLAYAAVGTSFLFGPFATSPLGKSFAIQALPLVIFFASLIAVLYHLRVMQLVVRWVGGAIEAVIGISKIESLCAAANIFVGQTESPLVIQPYLASLRKAQLFQVMTSGMSGLAGSSLTVYAAMGIRMEYLLAASLMSAPAAILMAKIVMPDDPAEEERASEDFEVAEAAGLVEGRAPENIIAAAAQGAQVGVRVAVMVGAMVFAFVGLLALANGLLSGIGAWFGVQDLTFQRLLGVVFSPVMFLMGVLWNQAGVAGGMLGEKLVLTEFVAYIHFQKVGASLSEHTQAIITFALCGFANFSSIAIQMAVTGGLAPNLRPLIAKLGLRALLAASLANLMSAALAGLLIG